MIHEDTYREVAFKGSKGLVFIEDKILTYRRDSKTESFPMCIDLPGGFRSGNESPFETFKRETKEEFGIEIEQDDIQFAHPVSTTEGLNKGSYFFVTKPLKIDASDIVFGNEGVEWMLMTPEEFIARPDGIERQQKRVKDYLDGKSVLF